MARVDIDHVKKAFGAVEIIHGVSIGVEDGEFVVLVGPSGCGKSTLLRMHRRPRKRSPPGEIRIDGRVVNDVAPKDRDIAMVFQNYALYPHMTVARKHGLRAEAARTRRKRRSTSAWPRRPRCSASTPLLDRYPRAAVGRPAPARRDGARDRARSQVFLFDEPLSNLDAKLRVQMRAEIKRAAAAARRDDASMSRTIRSRR